MDNRFKLQAGCFSKDTIINLRTAKEWGMDTSKLYHSWKELLDKEKKNIDAVIVLTPTPDHFKIITKAIDLGYPVISEKALTTNSSDAEYIQKIVTDNNAFLAVTYNY